MSKNVPNLPLNTKMDQFASDTNKYEMKSNTSTPLYSHDKYGLSTSKLSNTQPTTNQYSVKDKYTSSTIPTYENYKH